jgi:hypothetical protein
MAHPVTNKSNDIGSMEDYDLVCYNKEELAKIEKIENCMETLKSEKYQGVARTWLLSIHAKKRVDQFQRVFDLCPSQTACTCTIMDVYNKPECIYPGGFNRYHFHITYMQDKHCLLCGVRNCDRKDSTCGHKVLHDDCVKIVRNELWASHNTLNTNSFLELDKRTKDWETLLISMWGEEADLPYNMRVEREWVTKITELEVTLVEFTQKQVERRCFEAKWLAMAMGQHPRLGAKSHTSCMDPEILHIVMKSI